jgi:hypothetical protein
MKRPGYFALFAIMALTGVRLFSQSAQPAQPATAMIQAATTAASDDIDPAAIATLNKMGEYLRSLRSFQVVGEITRDEVLDNGQQVQFDSHIDMLARTPDRLRVEVNNANQQRLYLYDGKNFTVWAQRVNFYATVAAPPTIGKLTAALDDKYDLRLPLEDLFYWGTPQSKVGDIKTAIDVGPSEIGGVTCEHYVFHQEGLDWQVWIQQGDYPLPRKLVITTLTDDARPQYNAVLTWNLAPSFNEAAFEFNPPAGAQKIVLAAQQPASNDEK